MTPKYCIGISDGRCKNAGMKPGAIRGSGDGGNRLTARRGEFQPLSAAIVLLGLLVCHPEAPAVLFRRSRRQTFL